MSSYFTTSTNFKSKEAQDNVKKYVKNRQKFISKYINKCISFIDNKIMDISLNEGSTSYQVDLELFIKKKEFKILIEEYKIKNFIFKKDEIQFISETVKEYYNKHEFKVSFVYSSIIQINWC